MYEISKSSNEDYLNLVALIYYHIINCLFNTIE